jgi:hypothetical protein
LTGDRAVTSHDTPPMGADTPLNEAHLDRDLDRTGDVEAALAKALEGAAAAGRWDVVSQLARELEARRLARMRNVVALSSAKTR